MRIAEIYRSAQGEGELTGVDSVFVRASGCNLRCHYCDTPYASWKPEGKDRSVDDIIAEITDFHCNHVVITGGEPMLFAELIPLCKQLRQLGLHITIETAGTLYLPLACDLMSVSPKLSNSTPSRHEHPQWHVRHEQTRHAADVIRRLLAEYPCQFKFVIERPEDVDEVESYLAQFPELHRDLVWLMPEGIAEEQLANVQSWLQPLCKVHSFRLCPRRHIEWFGSGRGL